MSNPTRIAWLDLETTSLDPEAGEILEIGIVLTDLALNEIAESSWLVRPKQLDMLTIHPTVREMHTKNGLFEEVLALPLYDPGMDYEGYTDIVARDKHIGDWLRAEIPRLQRGDLALGGSGVSHFDVRWLKRHLPGTAAMFYRSTFDVGVIRRFVDDVANCPELRPPAVTRDLNHRALDDARNHLAEARHYVDILRAAAAPSHSPLIEVCRAQCPHCEGVCNLPVGHDELHAHMGRNGRDTYRFSER